MHASQRRRIDLTSDDYRSPRRPGFACFEPIQFPLPRILVLWRRQLPPTANPHFSSRLICRLSLRPCPHAPEDVQHLPSAAGRAVPALFK